jgi:hypothetical protein
MNLNFQQIKYQIKKLKKIKKKTKKKLIWGYLNQHTKFIT